MDSGDVAHLSLMKRPDLGVTFTKLHCWTLTHYSKCVFMDADTLVRSTLHEKQHSDKTCSSPGSSHTICPRFHA